MSNIDETLKGNRLERISHRKFLKRSRLTVDFDSQLRWKSTARKDFRDPFSVSPVRSQWVSIPIKPGESNSKRQVLPASPRLVIESVTMDILNATSPPQPLALFRGEVTTEFRCAPDEARVDSPVPAELLSLFEAITGWVVEFQETSASRRARINPPRSATGSPIAPKGQFSIVDMSASWPAGRPTSHRAKCDRFIKLFDQLIQNTQSIDEELLRLRSFVAAQSSEIDDSQELVDSFAPRCLYLTQAELAGDFELATEVDFDCKLASQDDPAGSLASVNLDRGSEQQLETNDPTGSQSQSDRVESNQSPAQPPRWQIGGRRGLIENRYVDWAVRKDHRLELIAGQIESLESAGDESANHKWESKLILNPETRRFWFSVEPRDCFWIFDGASRRLSRILERHRIGQLEASQALVVSTCNLGESTDIELADAEAWGQNALENADDLANAIQEALGLSEPLLVLLHV